MSVSVLCSGCGGRVPIPDDYSRARIRCSECGVMSDVPPAAQRSAASSDKPRRPPPVDADAASILLGDDLPPPAAEQMSQPKRVSTPLHPLPPSPNENATNEDDGRPYCVPGIDEERPCPQCRRFIPRDAVLCTSCGYNLQTGKKAKQEFEPVERHWHGGMSVGVRRGLFVAGEGLFVLSAIIYTRSTDWGWFGVVCPGLTFTLLTAFILGTYEQIHLTRNKKGRIRLTTTWSICFVPRPPKEVDLHDYGGVVYGPFHETGIMDWMVLIVMLVSGVIPGILWFYFVFIRMTFQVGLTQEYGYTELVLYRGSNERMIRDIADTLQNVAHLPCSKS